MAEGRSLRAVCRELTIPASTVRGWVVDRVDGFDEQYARARILQVEALADEIRDDAEDSSKDTVTRIGRDGQEYDAPDAEWINRSRLIVDTKKWLMSKIAPKQYGDKVQNEITGAGGGPLTISWAEKPPAP